MTFGIRFGADWRSRTLARSITNQRSASMTERQVCWVRRQLEDWEFMVRSRCRPLHAESSAPKRHPPRAAGPSTTLPRVSGSASQIHKRTEAKP